MIVFNLVGQFTVHFLIYRILSSYNMTSQKTILLNNYSDKNAWEILKSVYKPKKPKDIFRSYTVKLSFSLISKWIKFVK